MDPELNEIIPTRWTLIARLKDWDDQESWRQFFDIYWKLIYGVSRKSGLSPVESQDVVQETVMSVCRNIKTFQADSASGSFKSWLLNLTRWRIIDQVRKRPAEQGARLHVGGGHMGRDWGTTLTEAQIPDPAGNALDAVWDSEWERNLMAAALERLERQVNARQYQIFYLHVIKQYSPEQVARVAGVKTRQIYLVKHRLMQRFKEIISDLEQTMT